MPRRSRIRIGLECNECGARNYSLAKSKDAVRGKLVLKKYCPTCQRHTEHREGK